MNKKNDIDELFKSGIDFHRKGNLSEARSIYIKILQIKPDHFFALGNLGIIFSQLRQFDKAIDLFNKVIKINPGYAEGYNNLGNALYEISEYDKALYNYKKAVEINPKFSDALNNLGNVYFKKDDINKAIENYELSIMYDNSLNKDKPYYNLGNIFREQGNLKKSIDCYKKAIEINANSSEAYINLSISLNQNGDLKKAIYYCEKAAEIDPNNITAINNLGRYYQEIGNEDLSIKYYKKAVAIKPNLLKSRWLMMNTFPIVYKNFEQLNYFNKHFEENLIEIENLIEKNETFDKDQILSTLSSSTNFYLHYQSGDITNLQKRYGSVIQKLTKYVYPLFHKKISINKTSKPIKVGFISSHFFDHVISRLFKNWIIKMNKEKFKTLVYYIGSKNDHVTDFIKKNCNSFFQEVNINKTIDQINSDKLDVLIFLDIGMEPRIQIAGSLRLAPIQCCAYGVPITTGFENIDYFLSAEAMETESSHQHYSEKLIKLPALGVDYDYPKEIVIDNLNSKKEKNEVLFLSLQSNYKLLPQHDHIYFEIIKENPNSKFWFIGTKNDFVVNKFIERLSVECKNNRLNFDDYFTFYPQMAYQDYLESINKSDIVLDSLNWSGLNTSLDAISLDKPVLTLPSDFMRSRHTYGILKILKIDELISNSKKDYVDRAVQLSKDSILRENISKKIKDNKKLLFNNSKVVKSLEDFLLSLF